jgi:hypothetical protein
MVGAELAKFAGLSGAPRRHIPARQALMRAIAILQDQRVVLVARKALHTAAFSALSDDCVLPGAGLCPEIPKDRRPRIKWERSHRGNSKGRVKVD